VIRNELREAPEYLLPPAAYRSAAWFADEQAALFSDRWALVGSSDDLAEAGAYLAATVGNAPLLVVRGHDGALRALHNLCRHRGMQLLTGSGTCPRTIDCFYHQWRYGLDGALQVVPQRREQFPDLDVDRWGLLPASVDEWEGMVFAHPDPHAPPLHDALGGLAANVGSFRPGALRQVASLDLEAHCNWKLFVENHIDVYHLWYLHEGTLGDFDHTRFEHHQVGTDWFSYEPLRDADVATAELTTGTVAIGHLDERDRHGIGAHLLFPNLMVATAAEFFATYEAVPVGPDRSRVALRIRAEEGADAARLVDAVTSFITEDISACERVQAGLASPAFSIGPLARDHEAPITAFHRHVIEALGS
jgi:Rieske 2Fe-2S family protein